MTQSGPRFFIVYNADSGIINALMQAVQKQVSPETYPCSLCAITYGAVSMRGEWRRFLADLPVEVVIKHKDDFEAAYPGHNIPLPAILIAEHGSAPEELVAAQTLDAIADTSELIGKVEAALAARKIAIRHSPSVT